MVLRSFAQLAGGVVWAALILLRWIQKQFVHPVAEWWLENVLGTYEESLKSIIREAFSNLTRFLNGFFASVVALFVDKEYASTFRTNFNRTAAWQSGQPTGRCRGPARTVAVQLDGVARRTGAGAGQN